MVHIYTHTKLETSCNFAAIFDKVESQGTPQEVFHADFRLFLHGYDG